MIRGLHIFKQSVKALLFIYFLPAHSQITWAAQTLEFETFLTLALQRDAGLKQQGYLLDQIHQTRLAAGKLPDTEFSLSARNIPTGNWQFNVDPMSQWQVSVSQPFNRLGEAPLQQKQLSLQAAVPTWQVKDRKALLRWQLSSVWIKAAFAKRRMEIVQQSEAVLMPLVEVIANNYSNGIGQTNQQDVIATELALVRLQENNLKWKQVLDTQKSYLNAWIAPEVTNALAQRAFVEATATEQNQLLSQRFAFEQPEQSSEHLLTQLLAFPIPSMAEPYLIYEKLLAHPYSQAQQAQVQQNKVAVDLVQNKRAPKFAASASYGVRADQIGERNVDDLFSIGMKVSIPLFADAELKAEEKAAFMRTEAAKTERYLHVQRRFQRVSMIVTEVDGLQQRIELYENKLLPNLTQQAKAALNAYRNDKGKLSDAFKAKLESLALALELQNLKEAIFLNRAELAYMLNPQSNNAVTSISKELGDD